METQSAAVANTATAAQSTLPPQPPPPNSKKRPLDTITTTHDVDFKIRAILKNLRPHILEALRTPDFRNCKAAANTREYVKQILELCKQAKEEPVSKLKCPNAPDSQPPTGLSQNVPKPQEARQDTAFEKQQGEDGQVHGTYIIGGSAFGWNYVVYTGGHPVYYGVTKKSFRAAQAQLQGS